MAKVFTITEGVENLGALKTGGQGSVYKGKRVGEILTAIKLLPTPIHSEDSKDKNYKSFSNEVEKLKKVNENPNPNVVRIIDSGITETGSLPYIEMEFIEGPDLGELLKPPHDPVFTIHEAIKVALHLSNALAHCHKCDVKHGDIKSNNVKFNKRTGNYILLDFGLALMSDEDRRTSLRHAGAIEFMAPEQNEGQMLFQTDVYSFGVILYELLAGRVPFPLRDSGETARNAVMVSHMETPAPDLLEIREENLPTSWPQEKKHSEMQVPQWLLNLIYKCLEKKPKDRFASGVELNNYILSHTLAPTDQLAVLETSTTDRGGQVQEKVTKYKQELQRKNAEIAMLQEQLAEKDEYISKLITSPSAVAVEEDASVGKKVSRSSFITVLVIAVALGVFALISVFNNKTQGVSTMNTLPDSSSLAATDSMAAQHELQNNSLGTEANKKALSNSKRADSIRTAAAARQNDQQNNAGDSTKPAEKKPVEKTDSSDKADQTDNSVSLYKVKSRAYFHNDPDPSTRRDAFITHWNNAVLKPKREEDGYVYIVFTNHLGQTSKGWLAKKDLIPLRN